MTRLTLSLAPVLLGVFSPLVAEAQVSALPGMITSIFGSSSVPAAGLTCGGGAGAGACELAGLFVSVVEQGRWLIGSLALVVIVVAGFRLVISQSEEALTTARRTVLTDTIGLFVVFLSERFV